MATKKVIYFTAGPVPTSGETTAIGKLNAATEQPYSVKVMNTLQSPNYGYGKAEADLVAGTIPSAYSAVPTIDPDNIPAPLPSGQAAVANGGTVAVRNSAGADSHNATAVVATNTLTGVNLAATVAMVDNADTVPLQNSAGASKGNGTAAVAAGAITSIRTPATSAIVANNDALTVPVTGSYTTMATLTVANGVITGIALS